MNFSIINKAFPLAILHLDEYTLTGIRSLDHVVSFLQLIHHQLKQEKGHTYIHSGKGFNKLIGTSEWQLNMELDISHSLCNLVSLFLNWLHYFEQHQNILYPLTLMWILWEQSSVLARFVTTWHKQESFGKKDILLKKCHHQIDLWERMWSFLWRSVLLLMSSVSAHCGWCHPWNGGPAHCNKGCWALIHDFFCPCFLNQFECFPILGLRFRGKISMPSLFNPEAGWTKRFPLPERYAHKSQHNHNILCKTVDKSGHSSRFHSDHWNQDTGSTP